MMNYKKEINKFIRNYAFKSTVVWNAKKRFLKMVICGRDESKHIIKGVSYADLDIKKNFLVYLNDSSVKNFCK